MASPNENPDRGVVLNHRLILLIIAIICFILGVAEADILSLTQIQWIGIGLAAFAGAHV